MATAEADYISINDIVAKLSTMPSGDMTFIGKGYTVGDLRLDLMEFDLLNRAFITERQGAWEILSQQFNDTIKDTY